MARSLWKGAISFGLVNVPVELHSAKKRAAELDMTMLDKRDLAPVGYKRVNKSTGKEVAWGDVVKGYEYKDDKYVVLSDEDFRRANPEASRTVDILAFVELADIQPQFFETPYYLVPEKRGEKAYALLRETLEKAGKAGIASVVIRTKQYLAALVAEDDVMVLNTLRYADELKEPGELEDSESQGHGEGTRHGAAPGRGHGRRLAALQVQGHLPRGSAQAHQGKGQGRPDRGAHRA